MISIVKLYIEFFPSWLGPALISIGIVGIIRYVTVGHSGLLLPNGETTKIFGVNDEESKSTFFVFIMLYGIFLVKYPDIFTYFMYFVTASMGIIKAGTTVRVFDKIDLFIRDRSTGVAPNLLKKVLVILLGYFVVSICISSLILYYTYIGYDYVLTQQLRLWYTLVTAVVAFIGLYFKYSEFKMRNWQTYIFLSLTFIFVGSEIFNAKSITEEILVIAATYLVYHIMFIFYTYIRFLKS